MGFEGSRFPGAGGLRASGFRVFVSGGWGGVSANPHYVYIRTHVRIFRSGFEDVSGRRFFSGIDTEVAYELKHCQEQRLCASLLQINVSTALLVHVVTR